MKKSYTTIQLIKFLYGEAFVTDIFEIEDALQHDPRIAEELTMLREAKCLLPVISFSPSQSSIDSILEYGRAGQFT